MHVIPSTNYTLDASAGTITFSAPYNVLELSQLVKIIDLDTSDVIYDVTIKRDGVSVSGGVVTYSADNNVVSDTDELRIVIDDVTGSNIIASTVGDGRKTVTTSGTAEALSTSTSIREVTVTAELNNTGTITVGGATVVDTVATRRGSPLYPGDSVTIASDDLAEVFIDAEINGDGVTYNYLA
jgi:hypothetical protein